MNNPLKTPLFALGFDRNITYFTTVTPLVRSFLSIPQRHKINIENSSNCLYIISWFYLNTQMSKTFSLEQISRTGNLDANLILCRHKLGLMARFMEIKSINPNMKQT